MRPLPSSLESDLRDLLQRHQMTEHFDLIRAHARLSFLMRVNALTEASSAPLGATRLGGTPDLPCDLQWAINPEDGKLLDFIAQINLSEVPKLGHSLPETGLLLIYSSQESAAANPNVIQFTQAQDSSLTRAASPSADAFSDENTEEPFGSLLVQEFVPALALPDSTTFDQQDDDFHGGYYDVVEELSNDDGQKEPTSRLLGYPFDPTGSAMPSDDWELLVQIESHFSNGDCYMNFWDAGSLQLLVKHADLPTCQFSESSAGIFSM